MLPEWNRALFLVALDSSVRVLLVAAAIAGILILLRVKSGGLRHAAWTAVLAAMLLMPVLPYFLPALPIGVPPIRTVNLPAAQPPEPATSTLPGTPVPSVRATPPAGKILQNGPAQIAPVSGAETAPDKPIVPMVLLAVYTAGAAVLLFRLLFGWLQMNRLARQASPVELPGCAARVWESDLIATPLTLGVISQKVLIPSGWRRWSDEKLQAVLAHELAHTRRRDPLVAMLAHLNRCLFWFHPLAWWLERKLATTAEQACDDAAVRVIGENRHYAAILLDMAESVRRRGGRFSWQGVGVQGTGFLSERIDRVLKSDFPGEPSLLRKSVVAVGCAAAIFLIVACRGQAPAVVQLQPDPAVVQREAAQKAESDFTQAALNMNEAQVAELEATLKKNPEDMVTLKKLLTFYEPLDAQVPGKPNQWAPRCAQVIGAKACIEARRGHILWLVEHHPEDKLAGGWLARILTTDMDPLPDPVGYEQAKKLWLAKTAAPDVNVQVLRNAAFFFEVPDKALAEKMLLRAQVLDPKGKYSGTLGRLYALVLMGANSSMPLNVLRTVSMADAHGSYAQEIRKKLDTSNDAVLLATAADYLLWGERFSRAKKIDFGTAALARTYFERALQLDPNYQFVRERLRMMNAPEWGQDSKVVEILKNNKTESARYDAVSAMPEAERLNYLPFMAEDSYMRAEYDDYTKRDPARAQAGFEYAAKYAQDALRLGSKLPDHPYSSPAVYTGNMVLGTLAFKGGDRKTAVNYMLAASRVPASENLESYLIFYTRLTGQLLKYGERDSVIEFLERIAQLSTTEKQYLLDSANQIRKGFQPLWYPRESPAAPERK